MEKTIEIDGAFSDLIPNPNGIPCDENNSEKIRSEHSRWKTASRNSRCNSFEKLSYWQKVSTCAAL